MGNFRSHLVISVAGANPTLATHTLFDATHKESRDSALEQFMVNLHAINMLTPPPGAFNSYLGQLLLLGTIAAAESFVRTLFRRIISLDETAQNLVYDRDVSYGAALYLSPDLMPEALLEKFSFISKTNIVNALRELLAIKGNLPPELELAIDDYGRVCQMRHCAVHRFGKLGAKNAMALGMSDHKNLLEKPLKLDYVSLQNSMAISTGFVKTLNNFLFNELLSRVDPSEWSGVYSQDKRIFMRYYKLFSDKKSSSPSAAPKHYYLELQRELKLSNADRRRP